MNLIISGDQKHLARIEALARELGLLVRRELASASFQSEKEVRRPSRVSEGTSIDKDTQKTPILPHKGSLYGIE